MHTSSWKGRGRLESDVLVGGVGEGVNRVHVAVCGLSSTWQRVFVCIIYWVTERLLASQLWIFFMESVAVRFYNCVVCINIGK